MTTAKRQRIRVCLRSYEHKLVDVSAEKIVETAKRTDAKVAGPIPLPTKRRIYCVLRSPHVDKKSREHFEIRTHKRIIDIYEPTQQTTEELSRLDLPAGVDIEVKLPAGRVEFQVKLVRSLEIRVGVNLQGSNPPNTSKLKT